MNEDDLTDYEHEVLEERIQTLQRLRVSQLEQQLRIEQLEYQLQSCQERNQFLEDQNSLLLHQFQQKADENEALLQENFEDKQIIQIQERKLTHLQQLLDQKLHDSKYLSTMVSTLQTDERRSKQHLLLKLNHSRDYIQSFQRICLTLNDLINEIFGVTLR